MRNTLAFLIILFSLFSCTEKHNGAVILSEKIKTELDEFIVLIKDHKLKDESYVCLYFDKRNGKVGLGITLDPVYNCSYFVGTFYHKQEPVFIYFEKEDSLTTEDVKPAIEIIDSEKLKENCLKFGENTSDYAGFDPPVWAYEIDEGEIKLVHESKLRRQPK